MKFKELSQYLEKLEKTASRIEITKILSEIFNKTSTEEIDKATYLILGKLAPNYKSKVFNLAERMMIQAIAQAFDKKPKEVREIYKKMGDLGDVTQSLSVSKGGNLSVEDVYLRLEKIAADEGEGSQERKITEMAKLLSNLDPLSAKFVARIPIGKLRLGFSDKTILDALSWMKNGDKSAKAKLDSVYQVIPDVGLLAKQVKAKGIAKATKSPSPEVGVPVLPMLAQRLKSPTDMVEKMGKVVVEPKLDGLRILIHYKSGKGGFVKTFTRNLNETSWMFPELKGIEKHINAQEVIIDTEAVGLDEKSEKLANFQTTMTRRRKHEIEEASSKVPIKFYCFDLLSRNGENYMNKPYLERRKGLEKTIKEGVLFELVDYKVTDDPVEIDKINTRKQKEGLEGIMVKKLDALYVPGRTGWRWVKMKEAEDKHSKLADTIDCIVMGYSRGKGRRAQFGVGQFLVGVRDGEKIKTISKVGTGLTDEQFKELNNRLEKISGDKKPKEYEVHKNLEPDFWVTPKLVVEIAADEITKSPSHSAGLALRFPRLIKFRDDKGVSQATTLSEFKKLYKLQ